MFAESFKTFIFQKFRRPLCHKVNLPSCVARRPLCHKVNLPRCEARRRRFIMTCDIFGTGQTNILGLCMYPPPRPAPGKTCGQVMYYRYYRLYFTNSSLLCYHCPVSCKTYVQIMLLFLLFSHQLNNVRGSDKQFHNRGSYV